jgi:hypothetical protein
MIGSKGREIQVALLAVIVIGVQSHMTCASESGKAGGASQHENFIGHVR